MWRNRWAAIAAAGVLLPLAGARGEQEDFRVTARDNLEDHARDEDTQARSSPFRKKLKERGNAGKKTPRIIKDDTPKLFADPDGVDDETGEPIGWGSCQKCSGPGAADCVKERCAKRGYVVKYKAVTEVAYDGPADFYEPGPGQKASWPAVKLRRFEQDAEGKWHPTDDFDDYTDPYKTKVAELAAAAGKVAWKTDPNDPQDPGTFEFGQEPQEEEVVEEITFTFEDGEQAQGEAFFRALSAELAAGSLTPDRAILMGFTYNGPNVDYTVGSSRRMCFFGCFYLWDIRAGFALDFGLGLRAPAWSGLSGPASMIAGDTYPFSSVIDTAAHPDRTPGDWGPGEFSGIAVDPDPYVDDALPKTEGQEFVLYFKLFAGAKVKIFGVNVCPWCQYVEVDKNYSTSFATPFGTGTRFPLPTGDIPVKDFDFGIVSLAVGLYVTPNVYSTNISALASTGQEVTHAQPGVPVAFPVKACVEAKGPAPHWQTVTLDRYQYHFTNFELVLGAYLDFSVLGYGVWNPRLDFLTLDLSKALGSAGLYLPDHKDCNFVFQCTQKPALQQVGVTSEVLDQAAPETGIDLAGTAGKEGWFTSNVAATLLPADMPAGCGAGVASTAWGLADPPATPGASFLLAEERIVTAYWSSTDHDGNVEAAKQRIVKIDKTPPAIDGAPTTAPNAFGWYDRDVVVRFTATDATSGVASLTPDQTVSAEAADQEVTGTAEDHAGLAASHTVRGIDVDKTKPAVTITVPSRTGVYQNVDTFHIAWTATDGLSGIASEGGTLDGAAAANGQLVELVYLGGGHHVVAASAKDRAGNENGDAVTFLVDVDIDGLLAAVDKVCALDWVTKAGTCNSLRTKVLAAKASLAAGLLPDARGQLGAFLNELEAQEDKAVQPRAYLLLRTDAEYVLVRYGLVPPA